jgi:hypothetical protein
MSFFSTIRSFVENTKKVFTLEPHLQMDIDVSDIDFRRQGRMCTRLQADYRRCKNVKDIIGFFLAKGFLSLHISVTARILFRILHEPQTVLFVTQMLLN